MAQASTVDRLEAGEVESGCSLTCDCWDCRSYRRHLLKLTAAILLACGLGGEVAWQRGWWSAGAAQDEQVEPAGSPESLTWQ